MSNYNWERGSILIPAKAWPSFRKAFVQAWNAAQDALFQRALAARQHVEALAKGKRGFDRVTALGEYARRTTRALEYPNDEAEDLMRLLGVAFDGKAHTRPLRAPKRNALDHRPISKGGSFDLDDAVISLRDEERTVHWAVHENNRAVERAHEHPVARQLFAMLSKVEWTRDTGGVVVGNDEYNDGPGEGEGANYVSMRFGPRGGATESRSGRSVNTSRAMRY
jgi:hypothetical protein